MTQYGEDIYTEPEHVDVDTLANLGPLAPLAGRWAGAKGLDVNPKADGPLRQAYVETIDFQPIDPQANGPQLLYGLRYHVHVTKPGEVETYHDQVGYWLWEPATGMLLQTLAIPRGQSLLARGQAAADATRFEVSAERGSTENGITSQSFLEEAFRTVSYRIRIAIEGADRFAYDEDTVLVVRGKQQPFHHTDRNTLTRVAGPVRNPLARAAAR
jgi:hypothetical protein